MTVCEYVSSKCYDTNQFYINYRVKDTTVCESFSSNCYDTILFYINYRCRTQRCLNLSPVSVMIPFCFI